MAQKQLSKAVSAIQALLAIREKNRRLSFEEYLEKIRLTKQFKEFARKKNSKRS